MNRSSRTNVDALISDPLRDATDGDGEPSSQVHPIEEVPIRAGDTLPCPESTENPQSVQWEPIVVEVETAADEDGHEKSRTVVDDLRHETFRCFHSQFPPQELEKGLLLDEYVERFLALAKESSGSVSFVSMFNDFYRELCLHEGILSEFLDTVSHILRFYNFKIPGDEPVAFRTWRVTHVDFIDFPSKGIIRLKALNSYSGLELPVRLYDVLFGLEEY